jgi:ElaB/YqjD/DUF883 family membrane-anchored ribosome-binding protein
MATATADPASLAPPSTLRERVVDTARRVAHMSHEARMLKSVATDAVEDGMYKVRRAVTTARRDIDDARDDATHRIKQQPLKSVGLAFGVGVGVGLATTAVAWLALRACRRPD